MTTTATTKTHLLQQLSGNTVTMRQLTPDIKNHAAHIYHSTNYLLEVLEEVQALDGAVISAVETGAINLPDVLVSLRDKKLKTLANAVEALKLAMFAARELSDDFSVALNRFDTLLEDSVPLLTK